MRIKDWRIILVMLAILTVKIVASYEILVDKKIIFYKNQLKDIKY